MPSEPLAIYQKLKSMKESPDLLIHSVFTIASVLVASILLTLVIDIAQVSSDGINAANGSRIIVAGGGSNPIAFDDAPQARMPASTATWATWIATVTKVATPTPTPKPARALPMPPSLLLARLAARKPSIWGSRSFYILLGLAYVTLLGLFLKQVIKTLGRK